MGPPLHLQLVISTWSDSFIHLSMSICRTEIIQEALPLIKKCISSTTSMLWTVPLYSDLSRHPGPVCEFSWETRFLKLEIELPSSLGFLPKLFGTTDETSRLHPPSGLLYTSPVTSPPVLRTSPSIPTESSPTTDSDSSHPMGGMNGSHGTVVEYPDLPVGTRNHRPRGPRRPRRIRLVCPGKSGQ